MERPYPKGITSEEILALTSAKNLPNTYILGSFASKVTIASQQTRAFNLVWALKKSGVIQAGDSIGVIGGGFAGLSAAAGALLSQCKVTLYEENPQLLHVQRGNLTRYLHPNILDWPSKKSRSIETKLPYLNWSANVAEQVVELILRQWSALTSSTQLTERLNCRVTSISNISDQPILTFNHGKNLENHKVVIVAVGFGLEKSVGGSRAVPYWDDDSLHKPVVGDPKPRRYFVTGCGDGGLVDVLRLRFSDFRHDRFVEFISAHEKIKLISEQLLEIEISAKKLRNPDETSVYLYESYRKLTSKVQAIEILDKTTTRLDTSVLLNGSTITPLTLKSSILNRFAIFLLMMSDDPGFSYEQGRLDDSGIIRGRSNYQIAFGNAQVPITFDSVVIRHGPEKSTQAIRGLEQNSDYDIEKDFEFASKNRWLPDFFSKVSDVVTATNNHAQNEFTLRIDDLRLLLEAVRRRLQGDTSCEQIFRQIAYNNREQRGFAEFELALLFLSRKEYKDSIYWALRAYHSLPQIFRDSSRALATFVAIAPKGSPSKIISFTDRDHSNPFAHSFFTYTSLQKGWAYLTAGNHKLATANWRLTNQSVSHSDILGGYPFCHQTIPLDQLLIDLVANPNLANEKSIEGWLSESYHPALKRCGLMGHHAVIVATAEIIAQSDRTLKEFEDYARSWENPENKPTAENIKRRLTYFLQAEHAT